MRNKKPLIVALCLGFLAVALVFSYIKQIESQATPAVVEYGKVVIAKSQISPRTKVKEVMVEEVELPKDAIHPDAVTELDEVLGKVSSQVIFEGEQVLNAKFNEETDMRDLAFIIDEGKRAVTIAVSDVKGLGYNVKPGDHVDVVTTFDEKITGVDATFTLLANVPVRAIETITAAGAEGELETFKNVTLELTPQDAEKLVLADENGSVRLTLRHPDEIYSPALDGTPITEIVKYYPNPNEKKKSPGIAERPLPRYPDFNTPPPARASTPAPRDPEVLFQPIEQITVEVIKGGTVEEVYLEKPLAYGAGY
ncbi:MAG TPA: Flp pilus assembly protein CpaB [bacterium]|nr:Flp pilus assembly protein CpaB [bacterium]